MSWHPRGRFLEVEGRRAHCVDVGQGPPVLLLHGFLHSSYTWRATIKALATRHRVIAPDLVGFGWSDRGPGDYDLADFARWISGVLAALGVDRLHAAMGNSLGGGVLLQHALEDPDRVERLVLVSTLGLPLRVPALGLSMRVPSLPLRLLGHRLFEPLFALTAGNRAFVRLCLAGVYQRDKVCEEVLAGFEPLGLPGTHAAAVATAINLWRDSAALAERLSELTVPTLLVWGAHDGLLPLGYGRGVAERIPGARLEVFEDCGHCAHEEDPDRFHNLVSEFLDAAPAAGRSAPGAAPAGLASGA